MQFTVFLNNYLYQIILAFIMRIWDIPPERLCRNHLLGEHRELHAVWSILVNKKKGYANHPETLRWEGKLKALFFKHNIISKEMIKRGYQHKSPLNIDFATGIDIQDIFVDTIEDQIKILRNKKCNCKV
jgi:hypothetical protein